MISGDQVCSAALLLWLICIRGSAHAAHARRLQESKRVKFVFYVFVGSAANVMAKVTRPLLSLARVPECLTRV